jgi:CBS domain-containing protein
MDLYVPTVGDYMTPGAYAIAPHESVAQAKKLMRELGVRHLVVLKDDKLVGVLSERDIGARPTHDESSIDELVHGDPWAVAPDMRLNVVARAMAKHRHDSVVVIDHGGVVGVFTTTDALDALADALEGKGLRRTTENIGTEPPTGTRRARVTPRELRGRSVGRS